MDEALKKSLGGISPKPGVYLWKSGSHAILYVGKADNLRKRLKSYVNPKESKTKRLMEEAKELETIVCSSGAEALILEDALVKQNNPKYNVRLTDDKRYPYIRISWKDEYPRISVVRRVEADGSRYFGPYADSSSVRRMIKLVGVFFGICSCKRNHAMMKRPCMNHSLGICAGPMKVTEKVNYRKLCENACSFLGGEYLPVIRSLKKDMKNACASLDFEAAMKCRDNILAIESISQSQYVAGPKLDDMDVIGYSSLKGRANICQLKVRCHKVVDVLHHRLRGEFRLDPSKSIKAFIIQHYNAKDLIPKNIVTSAVPGDRHLLENLLAKALKAKVKITTAERGQKRRLSDMAVKNSVHRLWEERLKGLSSDPLLALKDRLGLPKAPARIEGYDISNIGDRDTVGSMAVFSNAKPEKSQYRMFGIKNRGQDDSRNMSEMISRRFKHDKWPAPDLVVLDGGLPQIRACAENIPEGISFISLAKKEEIIYFPKEKDPLKLSDDDPALLLLRRVRDEAHRFGKRYHIMKRKKRFMKDAKK